MIDDPRYTETELGILNMIQECGGIDGAHHKQFLLDLIVRMITGEGEAYQEWLAEYRNGPDGPETYEWDEGIPI